MTITSSPPDVEPGSASGTGRRAHSLRHTGITLTLDSGVPLRDVQDYARHRDARTTGRYDHSRDSLDRFAVYAVAAYLS